jgi:hydroxymethylbilane synthase
MKIVIGSRESALAVAQTKILLEYIEENCPGISAKMLTMKTTGDRILEKRLEEIGGKGLFVKELDKALLENRTQLSVHSLKDMPMEAEENLPVLGFSRREDPRDVLVLPENAKGLDLALPVGTSSLRRELQLKKLYPEMNVEMIRGNLVSRLRKLEEGRYSALVLAAAGLKRLGLERRIFRYFSCEEMLPAAGQGILAVQGRKGMDYGFLGGFFDEEAKAAALAERAFVRHLGGGCTSPVAAYAVCEGEELVLTGLYYSKESGFKPAGTDGCGRAVIRDYYTGTMRGKRSEAEELGRKLAEKMRGGNCL